MEKSLRKNNGFTLVELLVVIAIISILAGMLLPALENAIGQARMITCSSNQKQIYLGITFYRDDWNSFFPQIVDDKIGWTGLVQDYCNYSHEGSRDNWGPALFYCQEENANTLFTSNVGASNGYAINFYTARDFFPGMGNGSCSGASKIGLLYELWVSSWGTQSYVGSKDWSYDSVYSSTYERLRYRHNERMNVLLNDGAAVFTFADATKSNRPYGVPIWSNNGVLVY